MTNYRNIGKLVATFGFQGELILKHHLGKKTNVKGLETIFIETRKDELLPYFIRSAKAKNEEELILQLEDINTKETAHALTGKQVWFTEEDFAKHASNANAPIHLLGFHIINEGEDLGEILEIIEQPHQVLCRLEMKGKEVLIPIHEETIDGVDKKKKQVHVVLPDGLLEIYLG